MADKQPVLSLADLVERRLVVIGKEAFELKNPEEFGVLDDYQFRKRAQLVQRTIERVYADDPNLTEKEVSDIDVLVKDLALSVLIAPPEVVDRLQHSDRLRIINAFRGGPEQTVAEQTPTQTTGETAPQIPEEPTGSQTGETSSRG